MLPTNSPRPPVRPLGLWLLGLAALALTSCSSSPAPLTLVPVEGKVTVGGSPLPLGQVTFYPDSTKGNGTDKIPVGSIEGDGSYKIRTGTAEGVRDGAPPGWYKVTVVVKGVGTPEQAKAKAPQYNPSFTNSKQTPISIEVKEGASAKAYEINLTR